MYPVEDANEKRQIEEVFGLTGGELADAPLRYAYHVEPGGPGDEPVKRRWARYFYDGRPAYEERRAQESGSFITIVACELFGTMPRVIQARGKRWRKVASYTVSGETECPGKAAEDVVTAVRCSYCEADVGEEHGMIYIGDGWSEVVYRARD
jgi:hypothetical protein